MQNIFTKRTITKVIAFVLSFVCILNVIPTMVIKAAEQTLDTPELSNPDISSTWNSNGYYTGKYDETIDCNEDLKLRWNDVDADYYALNIIVLSGSPNPSSTSESRVHEIEIGYQTSSRTYTIDSTDLEDYSGKWVKVSIQPMMDNGDYGYRGLYYFQLGDHVPEQVLDTPKLSNPAISSTWNSKGYYTGKYGETIDCTEDLKLRWNDVDADYYALNIIVLRGSPNPSSTSESRVYEIEIDYHTTGRTYTIDSTDLEDYSGKWVKVSIQPMMDNGDYGYRGLYYFQLGDHVPEQVLDTPELSSPDISSAWDDDGYYTGKYTDSIDCHNDLKLRWNDVDADYYALNIIVLSGTPNPTALTESRVHEIEINYHTYNNTYTIDSTDLEDYAGRWVKVSIQPMMDNGDYGYRGLYYFQLRGSVPIVNASVTKKVEIGEIITISGLIKSEDSPINVVSIEISNPSETLGYYPYRTTSLSSTSFNLSSITTSSSDGSSTTGGIKTGGIASGYVGTQYRYDTEAFDFSEPGTYTLAIRAQSAEGLIGESIHYVELVEPEIVEPEVNSVVTSPNSVSVGERFNITAKTNSGASGVQFYVKENGSIYDLGSTKTVVSSTSTTKTFSISYVFNSTGLIENGIHVENTRRVYAYPIDSTGTIIEKDSVGAYYDVTVTPADHALSSFTAFDTEVTLGDSATIKWSASSAETSDIVYYNVYIFTETANILITPDKITGRSFVVDSGTIKEIGVGTHAVMVIATAANHGQKQSSANLIVLPNNDITDSTKPMINSIKCSSDPINYGSSVTFSTAASDETELDTVKMYIDDTLVKTVSANGTYTNISYTTSSLSVGNHIVRVDAYDVAGNFNSWGQTFTVEKIATGIIYNVEMSDYDFYAGSYITFTTTTSTDTTKIRLVDGSYTFSEHNSGYKDSNGKRVWTFEQYVGTVGKNRTLKVETYSGGWTGNYYITDPFTVRKNVEDVGDFEVLSPKSGAKHQVNTSLTVTWSEPDIMPDWYVVNVTGVPSGSNLIKINGNSAVISGSAFDEYGTYSISVTAQKSGYNQSEAYANVTVGCLHKDKELIDYVYSSETNYNDSKHKVTIIPKYLCNICKGTFTNNEEASTKYLEHDHDVELDYDGWLCDCGYVDSGSYTTWTGYLQSDAKEKAYSRVLSSGELTNWDGVSRVYPEDTITVLGTKHTAFLIRYDVGTNSSKVRFVDRTLVDREEYTGRSIIYVTIDGTDLRCVQEGNGTLYATAYDFAKVLNGSASFVSNNRLNCRMRVYDSISALNYYWAIDLRSYTSSSNWLNLDAYSDESLTTLVVRDFAGAYVYGDDINISIKGVLNLLNYEQVDEYAYAKKGFDYDLIKTASNIRDTDTMFTAVSNEVPWEWTSYAYSVAKLDPIGLGVAIADNTAYANEETVIALKKSLMLKRSDEHDKAAQDTVLKIFSIIEDVYNIQKEQIENKAEVVELGIDYYESFDLDIIIKAYEEQVDDKPGLKEPLEALKKKKAELKDTMDQMDAAMTVFNIGTSTIEFSAHYIDQKYTMWVLTQNYDDNIAFLNEIISTTDSSYMKEVYTDVREGLIDSYSEGLSTYLSSDQQGIIFDLIVDIGEISADLIDDAFGISDYIEAGIKSGKYGKAVNVLLLVHAGVSFVADFAFKGQDMYDAVADIYRAVDALPLMVDDLNKSIERYRENPTKKNLELVRTSAAFLAEYRISALEHCETYLNSLVCPAINVSAVTAEKNNIAKWQKTLY